MDLPMGERLLPWDPIPRESNVYLEVGVCRVEERADVAGMPVAVILVAARPNASDGAWRLLFQGVSAYRRLPVEAYAGTHLIALRAAYEQRSLPTPATYEVVRSHWLQEAVGPQHARPRARVPDHPGGHLLGDVDEGFLRSGPQVGWPTTACRAPPSRRDSHRSPQNGYCGIRFAGWMDGTRGQQTASPL